MGDARTSKRKQAQNMDRQNKAVSLFIAGATYQQIADQLGYHDRSTAARAVTNVINTYAEQRAEMAQIAKEIQVQRLESLWRSHYPIAMSSAQEVDENGVTHDRYDRKARATETCLRIWDRLNRVQNLDEPVRVEATISAGPSELMEEIAGLANLIQEEAARQAESLGIEPPTTPVIDAIIDSVVIDAEDGSDGE